MTLRASSQMTALERIQLTDLISDTFYRVYERECDVLSFEEPYSGLWIAETVDPLDHDVVDVFTVAERTELGALISLLSEVVNSLV
jgi:hypothetical protein